MTIRIGILVISDRSARGERADLSGPAITQICLDQGWQIIDQKILADDNEKIQNCLIKWSDSGYDGHRPYIWWNWFQPTRCYTRGNPGNHRTVRPWPARGHADCQPQAHSTWYAVTCSSRYSQALFGCEPSGESKGSRRKSRSDHPRSAPCSSAIARSPRSRDVPSREAVIVIIHNSLYLHPTNLR